MLNRTGEHKTCRIILTSGFSHTSRETIKICLPKVLVDRREKLDKLIWVAVDDLIYFDDVRWVYEGID